MVVIPFGPAAGGVGVAVVVRDDTDVTRDRVAASLDRVGVPLVRVRPVTGRALWHARWVVA